MSLGWVRGVVLRTTRLSRSIAVRRDPWETLCMPPHHGTHTAAASEFESAQLERVSSFNA